MRRRLFNLAAAVSLALCVGTAALWVRSRWHDDAVWLERTGPAEPRIRHFARFGVASDRGRVLLFHRETAYPSDTTDSSHEFIFQSTIVSGWGWAPDVHTGLLRDTGIFRDTWSGPGENANSIIALALPHWLILLILAPLPARWLVLRHGNAARRRAARGFCARCGYDLRATRDRCPECGDKVLIAPDPQAPARSGA